MASIARTLAQGHSGCSGIYIVLIIGTHTQRELWWAKAHVPTPTLFPLLAAKTVGTLGRSAPVQLT